MRVEAIFVAAEHGADPVQCSEVMAVSGKGLEGDRYFYEDKRAEVSFIDVAAIAHVREVLEVDVALHQPRRNVVTAGVELNPLVGRRFRIGDAVFEGTRLDHPCQLMESEIGPGARAAMKDRGGLYARVVVSGVIHEGDAVELLEREASETVATS